MNISKTRRALLLSSAVLMLAGVVRAEESFPSRPIRILVGFSVGGGTDTIARLYAEKLQQILGTPVIVENRPGASQLLAIRPTIHAKPDGYTLFFGAGSSLASGPAVRKDLHYNPLKDFSHIAMVATAPGIFAVNPGLPVKTIDDLIAYAKANPGKLNYGSAGVGSSNHLQTEYLKHVTGTNMVHVPYKSDAEVVREIAGGNVQFGLTVAQAALQMAIAGKVKAIAVTGSKRLPELPNVPSLAEANAPGLKDMDTYTFYGLVGPVGIPSPVIQRINAAVNQVSQMPDVAKLMRDSMLFYPATGTPVQFRQYLEKEVAKWSELRNSINLQM